MNTKTKSLIAVGVALAVIIALAIYYAPKSGVTGQSGEDTNTATDIGTAAKPVVIHHTLANKLNVYTGTITLPACTTMGTALSTAGTDLTIGLDTATRPNCTDTAPIQQEFTASFTPAKGEPVVKGLTLNGKSMDFTVVEGK